MKSSTTTQVGSIIRRLRRSNDFTQQYIAYKLNMSQNNVSKMERNKVPVTYKQLCALAKIFNVDPSIFFESHRKLTN